MKSLRARRLLILTIAVVAVTALTGAVASATCGGGGEGTTYAVDVSPGTWDGVYKQEKTFTVKNTGQDTLTSLETGVRTIEGGTILISNTCGKTLAAGATCSIKVKCLKQEEIPAEVYAQQLSPIAWDVADSHCTTA